MRSLITSTATFSLRRICVWFWRCCSDIYIVAHIELPSFGPTRAKLACAWATVPRLSRSETIRFNMPTEDMIGWCGASKAYVLLRTTDMDVRCKQTAPPP